MKGKSIGLRLALGEQPDMALVAVVHALAAQTFYRGGEASCLEIRLTSAYLASHADGIEDTPAAQALADRHARWASDMPRDVMDLWAFVAGLNHASLMALLAHCASLTVNAVRIQWEQKPNARATAEKLASAVALDMTAHWTPTTQTYLGRVTKAHIRDQATADADRIQVTWDSSGNQAITADMIDTLANAARSSLRIEGGGYRREHLRAFAQRIEVADDEVRIMGSKSELLQSLVAASGGESASFAVRSSVLKWRTRKDSNL